MTAVLLAVAVLADVRTEAPDGIPYRNTRYEDRGLKTHARYFYKVRPVFAGGRCGEFTDVFSGLTRSGVDNVKGRGK